MTKAHRTFLTTLVAAQASFGIASAQSRPQLWQKLAAEVQHLNAANLTYDYTIELKDGAGRRLDYTKGKLVRQGKDYYDSSGAGLTVVSGPYYCKVDAERKHLTVYNLDLVGRKLGMHRKPPDAGAVHIIDSLLADPGSINVDTAYGRGNIRVSYRVSRQHGVTCTITLNRRTAALETLQLMMPGTGDYVQTVRVYTIQSISNKANPAVFNLSRLFALSGSKLTPAPRYATYKITALIKE